MFHAILSEILPTAVADKRQPDDYVSFMIQDRRDESQLLSCAFASAF